MPTTAKKGYKGLPMEGRIARWYAKTTARDSDRFKELAAALAAQLPPGADVLEVAPGPGYLATELARRDFHVTGLDISQTFVGLAAGHARQAGVRVDFQLGNASAMPFADAAFDFIVCRAAFKNFSEPVQALCEMHRVLRPGGRALIIDLRPDAARADIDAHVRDMRLGWFNALVTRWTFRLMLLKRAYSQEQFRQMAARSPFGTCEIKPDGIGLEVTLRK